MSRNSVKENELPISLGVSDDYYSESLITYVLSSPLSKFSWLKTLKDVQKISASFQSLDMVDQRLYARLFARKEGWIRHKRIKYYFVKDMKASLENLESKGFVTTDYSKEELNVILDLLEKDEVKIICKDQKIDTKGNKSDMVGRIISRCKTQRTIMSMFGSASSSSGLIIKSVKKVLECVKLTAGPRELFRVLLVLVTYPHYRGEEAKRVSDLAKTLYEKSKGIVVFHRYNLKPVDVFKNNARFTEFEQSLHTVDLFISLRDNKKWKEAYEVINQCKLDFVLFLSNNLNTKLLDELKEKDMDYLMKFTSGRNYAYVLSKGIEVLKKESANWEEAIEVLNILLKQQYFLRGAKGHWYRELALVYEKKQDYESMVETLVEGLTDPKMLTSYSIISLIQKAESMGKRKSLPALAKQKLLSAIPSCNYSAHTTTITATSAPSQSSIHKIIPTKSSTLRPPSSMSYNYSPKTRIITATSAPSVSSSRKQIFVKNTSEGKEYSIVEEVAREHYSSELGFSSGLHDEGKLVVHCTLACFWEVIFCDIEGVFHSELQSAPLDWGTAGFYRRRKDIIEEFLKEIASKGAEESIERNVQKYRGVVGPVDWAVLDSALLEEVKGFLMCLKTDVFLKIAKYLLEDFRSRRSGLPDLTLWNPESKKCCFVEVKGPSDTLSPNQIKWLEKLNEFGASAEVCRVNTLHTGPKTKGNKRKHEEIKSD